VLVGDIQKEEALNQIKKYFLAFERKAYEEKPLTQEKAQTSKRTLDIERDLEMAYFALGYRSVDVYDEDMPALDVLSDILGRGASSRLNINLYRKKNLVYSIGSWNYTPKEPGIFIISGVAEPKKLEAALGAVSEEIKNIKNGTIDEEELERVKTMLVANYIYSLETLSGQAGDLALNELTMGDPHYTRSYIKMVRSVNIDQVKRVAEIYLKDESLSVVTLSPSSGERAQKEREVAKQKKIEKFILPNGLRCLLMEDHSVPTVSLVACCLGGLRVETKDNVGISNLTALLMLKGTPSRSEEEISGFVEGMGGSLSYFSGNNTLGIRLGLLSKDLEKGLDLFEDILFNPSFPEKILEREKKTIIAVINSVDDDIFNSGIKAFKETLFRVHPYRFQKIGVVDTVQNIKRDDLENFYKKYFIPNNMVIAIFGDIDKETLRQRLTEDFSELKKETMPEFTGVAEPDQKAIRKKENLLQKEQSLIIMGFKGATINSNDRYTLQIIGRALSGVSGRLAARLREKFGLAYTVGAFSVPAIDPGYFVLYVSTTSENIERAKKELFDQVKLLNKKGLTAEEIGSTKKELIGNQRIALQTNYSLTHQAALDELYGLGYDNYRRYDKIINSITNNDIINVSRKYLKPSAFTLLVVKGGRVE
jgi:zinc protease